MYKSNLWFNTLKDPVKSNAIPFPLFSKSEKSVVSVENAFIS